MATLVNIHEHREPTIPAMPKFTTGSLGLLTRAINMFRTVNSAGLGPDEFNNMSFDNNMDTWWLALPTELYSAITPETGLPTTLRGNTMCPCWDKLIMSPTPSTAICNMFYHATESHIKSNNWQQAKLLALCTNSVQQKRRIGNGTINLFNRGYSMGRQMQVEAGHFLNLTTGEFSTVQLWNITANTTGGNILSKIANATSWQQGFVWHYNTPVPIQQVTGPQHEWYQALINGLEYTGVQALNRMPTEVQQHLNHVLENQHPLQQGIQLPYWGAKTSERFSRQPNDPGICQCQHQHGSVHH